MLGIFPNVTSEVGVKSARDSNLELVAVSLQIVGVACGGSPMNHSHFGTTGVGGAATRRCSLKKMD